MQVRESLPTRFAILRPGGGIRVDHGVSAGLDVDIRVTDPYGICITAHAGYPGGLPRTIHRAITVPEAQEPWKYATVVPMVGVEIGDAS